MPVRIPVEIDGPTARIVLLAQAVQARGDLPDASAKRLVMLAKSVRLFAMAREGAEAVKSLGEIDALGAAAAEEAPRPGRAAVQAHDAARTLPGPDVSLYAVTVEVPGEPKAAQRPKVVQRGKVRLAIKADADVAAQASVAAAWTEHVLNGPLAWPVEKDRQYALRVIFRRGTYRAADLDNLAKTVLDGLNGLAYPDDSQVTRLVLSTDWTPRREGHAPSTLVQVRRLPLDMKGNPLPLALSPTTED